MMSEDHDNKDDEITNEEILDSNWSIGPMAKARQNLNIFCSSMLMQKSLKIIVDELCVLEDILKDDSVSIVDKVSAQQSLTILNSTWIDKIKSLNHI